MFRKIQEARENEEGFTLIELLVVVIIIGILAAIAIPVFLNQRESAWESAVESDLRNAAVEMETYATQNSGTYPGTLPADIQTSDGVALNLAVANNTDYCIEGSHTNVGDGTTPIFIFDSDAGGLERAASC